MNKKNTNKTYGITPQQIETLINKGNKDNANMAQNPETIHKYVADTSLKQYTLENILPTHLAQGHTNGDYHCHDLEYFTSRPLNCVKGDTPIIIKNNEYYDIVTIETLFEEQKKYSNIEVYTYNHKTKHGEFQPVNAVIKNPKTKLLKITFGSGQTITVSEDHEFYTYSNKNKKYSAKINENTVKAKELKERIKIYKNKPRIAHIKTRGIHLTKINIKSKLIGFFLGDGGITDNQARFTLRKPDKIKYLQKILLELGITYTVYASPTKNNSIHNYEYQIVIKDKELNEELKNIWINDKKLPEEYITENTTLGLLSGLISSDGYLTINNTSQKPFLEFKTINNNIKKTFETCCFLAGMQLVPHIQKRKQPNCSDIHNLIPHIYSSISLLKSIELREKQAKILENYEDEQLKEISKLQVTSVEEAGEDYVYTFNVHQNHNYLAGNGFVLNKNCLQHDLRLFIKYGLKVDGTGDHTSIAAPPTHMATVMNHSGEILLAAQQNMSGGQAFSLWNVFVAPFAHGLPYEQIKQCVEMFIFNLNMAYAARGGQVPFTSVGLEFTVPDFLKNEPAYGPGGKIVGVYGDYEKEVRQIQRAFTEILLEGDAKGKPHLFPNTIYYIREECLKPEFDEDIDFVHYLSAKFGTAYYINMLPEYMGNMANYMGCRTRLSDNWTGDWEQDCLRTGNLAYVTLNLPRMAYKSKSEDELFDYLDENLAKAEEILLLRRERAIKCLDEYKILPFLTQKFDGEPYYRVENSTLSFGFVGLNETLQSLTGSGLEDKNSLALGHRIIDYINDHVNSLKADTNIRWGVIQTPAESTSYRFATLDKKEFGDKAIVHGEPGAYYYSNSNHTPVDTGLNLPDKIRIESPFHPKTQGGHIFHAFMGESYSDPESLRSLTDKICHKSDIGFWAYSSALSFCNKCGTIMKGLHDICSHCGETHEVEWYDRITGYVQQVGHSKSASSGWNAGKKQELVDRRRFEQ